MEAAINRRAVARRIILRRFLLVVPVIERFALDHFRQRRVGGGGAEDHARTGACRAGDLAPQRIHLVRRHPVLRIEQYVTVERLRRTFVEIFGQRTVERIDALGARTYLVEIIPPQVGRQRTRNIVGI